MGLETTLWIVLRFAGLIPASLPTIWPAGQQPNKPKRYLATQIGNKDKDNSLEDSYPDVATPPFFSQLTDAQSSKEGIFRGVQTAPEISRYFSLNTSSCIGFSSQLLLSSTSTANLVFVGETSSSASSSRAGIPFFLSAFLAQNEEPNKSLQHMKKIVETTLMYSLLDPNTPFFNFVSMFGSVYVIDRVMTRPSSRIRISADYADPDYLISLFW